MSDETTALGLLIFTAAFHYMAYLAISRAKDLADCKAALAYDREVTNE